MKKQLTLLFFTLLSVLSLASEFMGAASTYTTMPRARAKVIGHYQRFPTSTQWDSLMDAIPITQTDGTPLIRGANTYTNNTTINNVGNILLNPTLGVGIGTGTVTPACPLEVDGTLAAPAHTGTVTTALFRLDPPMVAPTKAVLDMGVSLNGSWIQSYNALDLSSCTPLFLQPWINDGYGVGIGTGSVVPTANLCVFGSSGSTLMIKDGNQGASKILTSDANGMASWATNPSTIGGSNTQIQFNSSSTFGGARIDYGYNGTQASLNAETGKELLLRSRDSSRVVGVNNTYAYVYAANGASGMTAGASSVDILSPMIQFDAAGSGTNYLFYGPAYAGVFNFTNIASSNKTFTWQNKSGTVALEGIQPYAAHSFTATETYTVSAGVSEVVNTNTVACTCTVTIDMGHMSPVDGQIFSFLSAGDITLLLISGVTTIDSSYDPSAIEGGSGVSAGAGFWSYQYISPAAAWVRRE